MLFDRGRQDVPFALVVGIIAVFLIFVLFIYYYEIVRPFKILMRQMKALLTGQEYRRVFTKRMDEVGIFAHFFNEVTKSFEKKHSSPKSGQKEQKKQRLYEEY